MRALYPEFGWEENKRVVSLQENVNLIYYHEVEKLKHTYLLMSKKEDSGGSRDGEERDG